MRGLCLGILLCLLAIPAEVAAQVEKEQSTLPEAIRYGIRFDLDPKDQSLAGTADVTIVNPGEVAVSRAPLLLYRLMDVESVTGEDGRPLVFAQRVVRFSDEPTWQVNAIQVTLATPLAPRRQTTLHVRYGGPLVGLREVMQYVHDTVSDDYTLLRAETIPYPMVAPASEAGWRHFLNSAVHFDITTVVPAGQVAVCAAPDAGEAETREGRTTYHCAGEGAAGRINVAVSRFRVLEDSARGLRVYAMPTDAAASDRVMGELRRALDFYRSYLGEARGGTLALVEIPEGWGSYLEPGTIFQAAAAFKDEAQSYELWHEVAHRWNACGSFQPGQACSDTVQRTRWFDEAFASYFEGLAMRQFDGPEAFRAHMERSRQNFIRRAERDPRGRTTPIAEYAKEELGGFSYTKGAWSLYVLHTYLGEEAFRKGMSEFVAAYRDRPVDFAAFRSSLEKSTGRDLGRWYQQWILSGTDSSDLLIQGKTVEEMAAMCGAAAGR